MDTGIKESVDLRRKTLDDYYRLPPKAQAEADAVFEQMELLGEQCANRGEFELKLMESPVNAAYNDLFGKFVRYARRAEGTPSTGEIVATAAADSAKSIATQQLRNGAMSALLHLLPRNVADLITYRGSVHGTAEQAADNTGKAIDLFGRLFGKKE